MKLFFFFSIILINVATTFKLGHGRAEYYDNKEFGKDTEAVLW